MPPRTLYGIKCMLAVIYLGVKKASMYIAREKTLARSLQHKTQTREGASQQPYTEAHAQVRPTAFPRFALVIQQLAESVQPSFAAVTESRKSTESGRKAEESWTSPHRRLPSILQIIRYVLRTRPQVSRFISYMYLHIGHDTYVTVHT